MITKTIDLLALFTLLSGAFLVLSVLYLAARRFRKIQVLENLGQFFKKYALVLAFFVALTATLGSLFFSEIAKFTPCELCWFQRVFMYPQALILAMALYYRDSSVKKYIIAMSAVGAGFSLYNYYLQLFPPPVTFCAADSLAACSNRIVMAYGYITFAVMSLTASLLIIFFMSLKTAAK